PSAAARAAPGVPQSTTPRHSSHRRSERLVPSRGGQVGTACRSRLKQAVSNLTPSQRWTAAMRLADGDPPVLAAALAGASPNGLERLLAEDAGFNALV